MRSTATVQVYQMARFFMRLGFNRWQPGTTAVRYFTVHTHRLFPHLSVYRHFCRRAWPTIRIRASAENKSASNCFTASCFSLSVRFTVHTGWQLRFVSWTRHLRGFVSYFLFYETMVRSCIIYATLIIPVFWPAWKTAQSRPTAPARHYFLDNSALPQSVYSHPEAASTVNTEPSVPITLTVSPASISGPTTCQRLSSTETLP